MISLPPKGSDAKKLGSNFAPLRVEAQASPNMTVKVAEGAFWTAENEFMEYIGGTSPNISAPTADAKWVLVTVTTTGMLNIVNGAASTTPVLPDPSSYKDELPLAAIFIGNTTPAITNDMIYDLRPLWSIPPDSVSQTQLDGLATVSYVDNSLAAKAGTAGTNSQNFNLDNAGAFTDSGIFVGQINDNNLTNPGIRFNETAMAGSPPVVTALWEFTNDGATWNPIGVSSGSYFTKDDLLGDPVGSGSVLDVLYFTKTELSSGVALDTRYYEMAIADTTFAPFSHTHDVSEITNLADPVETVNGVGPTLGNISLGLNELLDVSINGAVDTQVIINRAGAFKNDYLHLGDIAEISTGNPDQRGNILIDDTGSGIYINRPLVKDDITDFDAATDFVLAGVAGSPSTGVDQDVFGVKTFKDGVVIETSLVVKGGNTSIETTELKVSDPYIVLNSGETGDGVGGIATPGVAGIAIDRGPNTPVGSPAVGLFPPALIAWNEATNLWEAGVVGNASPILTGAHTHIAAQVTDFAEQTTLELGRNNLSAIKDVAYTTVPQNNEYLRYDGATTGSPPTTGNWKNRNFADDVNAELNVNTLDQMSDVTYLGSPALIAKDFLQWTGTEWVNHTAVKSDISDFTETDYLHTNSTPETKEGDLTINGDFTIGGSNVDGTNSVTIIDSAVVKFRDSKIELNYKQTSVGVTDAEAGIQVNRGTGAQPTNIWWSEAAGAWLVNYTNVLGSPPSLTLDTGAISVSGHTHVLGDVLDVTVSADEVNTLDGILTTPTELNTVQKQLDTKFDGTFDVTFEDEVKFLTPAGETIIRYVNIGTSPISPNGTDIIVGNDNGRLELNGLVDGVMLLNDGAVNARETGNVPGTEKNLVSRTGTLPNVPLVQGPANYNNEIIVGDSGVTTAIRSGTVGTNDPVVRAGVFGATDDWKIWHEGNLTPATDADLATHEANLTIHFTEASIDHMSIQNIGTNTHDMIDNHISDNDVSLFHGAFAIVNIPNIGTGSPVVGGGNITSTDVQGAINELDGLAAGKEPAFTKNTAFNRFFTEVGDVPEPGTSLQVARGNHGHVVSEISDFAAGFDAELSTSSIGELQDVNTIGATLDDILQFDGGVWRRTPIVSVGGFVHLTGSVDETMDGVKTFADNAVFNATINVIGDTTLNTLTVGSNASIDGDLTMKGFIHAEQSTIALNFGSLATPTADGGGIVLQRNTGIDDAIISWHGVDERWQAGLATSVEHIALENVTPSQPFYEILPDNGTAIYNPGFGGNVPQPAVNKTGLQVFVNGIKQIEGKSYTVDYTNPLDIVVTFEAGSEPVADDDVEFYGFGFIG